MKSFLKICVVISSILSVLGSVNNNGNTVSDNSDILNFFETFKEKEEVIMILSSFREA